ncbi:MAG: SUMF1/EgtB/PvdO family nonheme iron enzyme [Opitutales bacterium]|nr:SUMF1/EgtB/PvdO family nonheme iron enzyme [Opitutales bacterium]
MSSEDETILGDGESGWNQLEAGTKLDNYRIERLLGQGGMGAVYLAEHQRLGQKYALKVLPRELSGDANFQQRFVEEGRRMAALEHPHIVPIHYAGEAEGLHYFAMQHLPGGDLEQALRSGTPPPTEIRPPSGAHRLPPSAVRRYLQQLLQALTYAHGQGVVHRDLKPANLLLTDGGQLKVTDFGLAQVVGKDYLRSLVEKTVRESLLSDAATVASGGSATGDASYAGTIDFMAPEVRNGQDFDARSDLYAVGVIGYYLLTGKKPFGRYKDASQLVEGLDPAWDAFLDDLMAGDPEDRIQTAEAALAVLPGEQSAVVEAPPAVEAPPKVAAQVPDKKPVSLPPAAAASRPRRGKGLWFALAVVLLLAGGAGGWVFGIYLPQERAFEEMRERIAALPITAESRAVESLDEAVQTFVADAPDRHVEPIEGAWAMRRDEIEMRRDAFDSLREEIGSLPTDAPMAELEALDDVVGAYMRQAPEAHRDRIASEWEQQRADIESYWENARGGLILDTEPSGAEVRIDGLSIEESPVRLLNLLLGSYTIDIVHPDYERWTGVAEVEDGRFTDLGTIELQRSTGGLRVSADSEAIQWTLEKDDAEIDSREGAGSALLENLPTGDYTLKAQRDDWPEQVHEVEIDRSEVAELVLKFPFGSLRLTSEPSGAEIWVGGERIGVTPYQIGELPPGKLKDFEFRKEGYFVQIASGRIEAGEERILLVELVEGPPEGENYTVDLGGFKELDLVWIEPGQFVMGSPLEESGRREDEGPQTTVRLTRGYWLGKTPVTQGQWQTIMGTNIRQQRDLANREWSLWGEGSEFPIYYVSWNEAMEFCRRLTERERSAGRLPAGYSYTLPSEAQWEYATRAGTSSRWSFGDRQSSFLDYAWYTASGASGGYAIRVASKRANPWGLYDVHGNVLEWTRSWSGTYPGGIVVDYEGPASGTFRVFRGGSWDATESSTRSARRFWDSSGYRSRSLGFRLALAPTP